MPKEKSAVASAAAPLPLGASLQNGLSVANLQQYFLERRTFALAKDEYTATPYDNFMTAAYAIRDRMIERWIKTQQRYHKKNTKRVYYLSMEFLIGRLLMHGILNLGVVGEIKKALQSYGLRLEDLAEKEVDILLWDGGNNDLPFFRSDLHIVVVDPHRPGHELMYHPGETNFLRAGVLVINKMDPEEEILDEPEGQA